MTEPEVVSLGPAFAAYLRRFRGCLGQDRTAGHFDTSCRGLRSDLPRKSIEPIARAAGTAVHTPQEFLVTARCDHAATRATLHRHPAEVLGTVPADGVGTVGVIDETSCRKWGDHTPGVPRQYPGCVGKVGNGIVTVHLAVARGTFQARLDADLFLPQGWPEGRPRCRAAGIPDDTRHRPKWRLAVDQRVRAAEAGVRFDGLTFDEGYGAAVPLLRFLNLVGPRFVAEVPVNVAVRDVAGGPSRRADARRGAAAARGGTRHPVAYRTARASVWRAATARVWVWVARVLAVAFRRWAVEHAFRLGKPEAGLMDDEGRKYTGRMRHRTLALVVLGFVAIHTARLRGEKPGGDRGAGVPGVEPTVRGGVPPAAGRGRGQAHQRGDRVPPVAERPGGQVPQEAAA